MDWLREFVHSTAWLQRILDQPIMGWVWLIPWLTVTFLALAAATVQVTWSRRPRPERMAPELAAAARRARNAIVAALAVLAGLAAIAVVWGGTRVFGVESQGVQLSGDLGGLDEGSPYSGLLLFLAPMLAATAALAFYALQLSRRPTAVAAPIASASLTPRDPARLAPAWAVGLVCALAAALATAMLIFGTLAIADDDGYSRWYGRYVEGADGSVVSSPFPGWFYGIATLLCLTVLVGVLTWVLWINARRPSLQGTGMDAADRSWRADSATVALLLTATALTYTLMTALSMGIRGIQTIASETHDAADGMSVQLTFTLPRLIILAGFAGCLVLLGMATRRAGRMIAAAQALSPADAPEGVAS